MVQYFVLLYLNSAVVNMRLKYHYSVISVSVDSLPGNTKNRESTRSWLIGVRLFNPCAGSATDSDFPRPVRSVKRSRFAATVFARSKPVNWGRSLPKILVFLTEKTKTDALHILARTHLLVLTFQQSCLLLVIIDQICRKRSRSDRGSSQETGAV